MIEFFIPIELPSLNKMLTEHWRKRHVRNKKIATYIKLYMKTCITSPPCLVSLTREGPRRLDEINAMGSFKHVQDVIADFLIPGLAPGQADSDPRIKWEFKQETTKRKGFFVRIAQG